MNDLSKAELIELKARESVVKAKEGWVEQDEQGPSAYGKLTMAIERQNIIDHLEYSPGLVSTRRMTRLLDRTLEAWRHWGDPSKYIKNQIGIKSFSKYQAPSDLDKVSQNNFDEEYLSWFDGLVSSLSDDQTSAICYEAFKRENRRRAALWAKDFGLSQRTYYKRIKEARELLIVALINRF